jgi:hypothetical protein
MPPNGTYAELHTPDQGVRLLASSNLEKGETKFFLASLQMSFLIGLTLRLHLVITHAFQRM